MTGDSGFGGLAGAVGGIQGIGCRRRWGNGIASSGSGLAGGGVIDGRWRSVWVMLLCLFLFQEPESRHGGLAAMERGRRGPKESCTNLTGSVVK